MHTQHTRSIISKSQVHLLTESTCQVPASPGYVRPVARERPDQPTDTHCPGPMNGRRQHIVTQTHASSRISHPIPSRRKGKKDVIKLSLAIQRQLNSNYRHNISVSLPFIRYDIPDQRVGDPVSQAGRPRVVVPHPDLAGVRGTGNKGAVMGWGCSPAAVYHPFRPRDATPIYSRDVSGGRGGGGGDDRWE